jgi:integrase
MRVIKRLRYINHYRDRHGRQRYYFRRGKEPQIALPGEPGEPEFDTAYRAALAKLPVRQIGRDRSPVGTISAAIGDYYTHNTFTTLGKNTQQARRAVLEHFRRADGGKPIAMLEQKHLNSILGKLKPFAQHNWLKALRGLMQFAIATGLRKDDPTAGIERVKAEAGSIHTWTEGEIARYLTTHPKGTRAWKALILLLYTGQRGGDVVRMGQQHLHGDRIFVKQQKTGTEVLIPIHPVLREIVDEALHRLPEGVAVLRPQPFLARERGGAYETRGSFTNQFRVWCDEAGLPQCSAHGLRKAMCRRLAEAGCSAMQIAAITGHKTLAEVERYVKDAEQTTLADQAMKAVANL